LSQTAEFKPGESQEYSNTGYILADLIMDKVLGMHHSVALRNCILVPLDMEKTFYKGVEKDHGDFISDYHKFDDSDETFNSKLYQENVTAASSPLVSSVEDMTDIFKKCRRSTKCSSLINSKLNH